MELRWNALVLQPNRITESWIKIKEKPTAVLKSTGTSREFRAFPIPLSSFIYGRTSFA